MATGKRGGRGIKDRQIGASAGIRPFKLDLAYATEAAFLTAKSANGENSSSAEEGDFFYDSTVNALKVHNGTAWVTVGVISDAAALANTKIWIGSAAGVAQEYAISGDATMTAGGVLTVSNTAITAAKLASSSVTPAAITQASGADQSTAGSGLIACIHMIPITAGAAGNSDITMSFKSRIHAIWAIASGPGEAGDTLQVFNGTGGSSPITPAMAWDNTMVDGTVVKPATLLNRTIAATATVRATTVDADAGSDVAGGVVYILCSRTA